MTKRPWLGGGTQGTPVESATVPWPLQANSKIPIPGDSLPQIIAEKL
jgi:hypothetical protein